MKFQSQTLPDDPTALKQMLVDLQSQLETEKRLNQTLTLRLQALLRQRFGRSSEKQQDNAQLDLLIEDTETAIAATDLPVTDKPATQPVARARKPLPAHLPRTVQQQEPASCDCPECGKAMTAIGEDVSELLDVVPAQYRVIKIVRPKYSCKACERIVQAPAQERVIDQGMASSALIAQMIVDKYADHLPLYRQAERLNGKALTLTAPPWPVGWVGPVLYFSHWWKPSAVM